MNTAKLGEVFSKLLDDIGSEDTELGEVMVLVELKGPEWATIAYRCSDNRVWVQRGMLHEALEAFPQSEGDE